ncbi:MAG: ankyrin repeat domain-containing protein [Pseudomonadota bacterium]
MSDQARLNFIAAVRAGETAEVAALLRRAPGLVAEIDAPIVGEEPAVVVAGRAEHYDLVDLLLSAGADINAVGPNSDGLRGVLHSSFSDRQAGFLIERGIALDAHGAARWALSDRLAQMLTTDPDLARRPYVNRYSAMPLLHQARSPEIAALILAHGAEIDVRDTGFGGTAAQWGLVEISFRPGLSRYLIEQGGAGDVILYAGLGMTDRLSAELNRDPSLVHAKTGLPPLVPAPAPRGHIYTFMLGDATPLVVAAYRRQPEACALLLARGAEVNAQETGFTPLHWAAAFGQESLARLLIANGADPSIKDNNFQATALGWAIHNDQAGIAKLLAESLPELSLYEAAYCGRLERVKALIDADPSTALGPAEYPGGALRAATLGNHLEIVRLLLTHGADPSLQSQDGRTALAIAEEKGHGEIAALLRG